MTIPDRTPSDRVKAFNDRTSEVVGAARQLAAAGPDAWTVTLVYAVADAVNKLDGLTYWPGVELRQANVNAEAFVPSWAHIVAAAEATARETQGTPAPADMAAEGLYVLPERLGNITMLLVEGASDAAIAAATGWCRGNNIDPDTVPSGTPLVIGYGQIRYEEWLVDEDGLQASHFGPVRRPARKPLIVPIPAEWMSRG